MKLVYESIENDLVICSIYENDGRYEAWVNSWKGTASTFDEAMEMAEKQINQTILINLIEPEKILYMGDREYAIILQKHTPPIRIRGKNPELVVVVTY